MTAPRDPATAVVIVLTDDGVGETFGVDDLDELDGMATVGHDSAGRQVIAVDATAGRNGTIISRLHPVLHERAGLAAHPDPGILVTALALAHWHSRTRHCPRCGTRLRTQSGGRVLVCDQDGSQHFPRLEPAMIVAVVDCDDRLLLGRQEGWPDRMFSTLAGFVEPGETIEETCRREVAEESGVAVGEVRYVASQPWPFPASLMFGLHAFALTTELVLEDEIVAARWFSRDELTTAIETGDVTIPPSLSISHRLITEWHSGVLARPPTA